MILTKKAILERIKSGKVNFKPQIDAFQLQPHAVDLRLGYKFLIPKNWTLTDSGRTAINVSIENHDIHREQFEEVILKPGQHFDLLPNEFVIGTSLEYIEINDTSLMSLLFPRTSTNRRGINLSLSGIIDTGYHGHLIIPIKNEAGNQVIRLFPGERICQIIFEELTEELEEKEAMMHGLAQAKYSHTTDSMYQTDKSDEKRLLAEGKLDELKQKFGIN